MSSAGCKIFVYQIDNERSKIEVQAKKISAVFGNTDASKAKALRSILGDSLTKRNVFQKIRTLKLNK